MDFHQLLIERRSIRRYTDREIDPEQVKLILEAALLSPTSKSARAWHFVVVEDKATLGSLANCKKLGATGLKTCPLAVVVAVDSTESEAWVEDASVAAFAMQLQARALGVGSCWIQLYGRYMEDGVTLSDQFVQDTLGVPEQCSVLCVLTFGYPDEQRKPQDTGKLKWDNVHIDKW